MLDVEAAGGCSLEMWMVDDADLGNAGIVLETDYHAWSMSGGADVEVRSLEM